MVVKNDSAKLSALSARRSCMLSCVTCLLPTYSCASLPCVLHALVRPVPRALRVLVSHLSYVLLYLTCLAPCVFSDYSYFMHYVLLCSSSFNVFRCFKPNIRLCISCLVAFMACAFGALAV